MRNYPLGGVDPDGHCPECVWEDLVSSPEGQAVEDWIAASSVVVATTLVAFGKNIENAVTSTDWSNFNYSSSDPFPMNRPTQLQSSSSSSSGQTPAPATGQSTPANPNGQKGAPDHQAGVKKEADKARAAAGPGETVLEGKKVQGYDSTRRPDVQTVGANKKTKSIVEVERRPNSARNKARETEYKKLGIPNTTKPIKKPIPN
jgi:hypothetical protein